MIVLVVDDSNFNLAVADKHLKEIISISQVILCSNPNDVKSIINENQIDILILDLIMPRISGFEILDMLRSNSKYDDLPIIVFTSLDDVDSFKKCFEMGASDYINKPIREYEFRARLSAAIRLRENSKKVKNLLEFTTKQNEELKLINEKLKDAKFSLIQSEKMAAIGQLAAGIAHEINNPMGFINSNFEVISKYLARISEYLVFLQEKFEDDSISPEIKNEFKEKFNKLKLDLILPELDGIICDSKMGITRVNEIVHSLTAFARSSSDNEVEPCNLLDIINQVILISKNVVKYIAKIELDVDESIMIHCSKVQIWQVFLNIIVNAAHAIKSQAREEMGKINISASCVDKYVVIDFFNDGPIIPEHIMSKIFEPFFTTKEIGEGTGLGLSISYDIIVNKHNGQIDVKSNSETGTVFTITLPL